jgi:hypothetical protein
LRGHYNVQNLDFDLSQFGLFLNNDIIFINVHYNDMIDIVGRKLMVGDVLELPHLLDYNPLQETIPVALKRFYSITDANFSSEGFSQTWYPHMWRIKCEPLVDSEEFSQILAEPINQDNYLGIWDKDKTYPPGYVITFGDKNYISKIEVPPGIYPPDPTYWELDTASNLKDILATYNKNIAINNAALQEAERLVPKSGYDRNNLYIVPTYGTFETNTELSGKYNQPAPPVNVVVPNPVPPTAIVSTVQSSLYSTASPVLRISAASAQAIWDMTVDGGVVAPKSTLSLRSITIAPTLTDSGSGAVSGDIVLSIDSIGFNVTGPYGTADNTYATADQNPEAPNFTGTEPYGPNTMDYRADCDPRFQFIARSSPRSFGYTTGYLDGDGTAPNGFPTGAGIAFPQNPKVGDYFLRIDYLPQLLYRWDGRLWVRISENVRTQTGMTAGDLSQQSSFINNSNVTVLTDGATTTQKQGLSTILTIAPDPIPPQP